MRFLEGFILGCILFPKRETINPGSKKNEYSKKLEDITNIVVLLEVIAIGLFIFGGFAGRVLGAIIFFFSIIILIKEI